MPRLRPCALALVFAGLAGLGCGDAPQTPRRPNIVLFLVDTLRKDGLHLYGNERRTSDAIDALAREGWVFEHHIASASQTVPSLVRL